MPSLYGIPIPTGAKQIEVKPVLGKGPTRALFRGQVEENGSYITEDQIADAAARDPGFWEYMQAQAAAGRVKKPEAGIWCFRLAVSFLDQFGACATIDPDNKTTHTTEEAWEFIPSASLRLGAAAQPVDPVSAVLALARDLAKEHTAQMQEARCMFRDALTAAQAITTTATNEAQKLLAAGGESLRHAVDHVVGQAKHESTRADDATKDVVTLLRRTQTDSWIDDLSKLAPYAPLVIPLAKKLVN